MTRTTHAFVFMKPLSASKSRLATALEAPRRELMAAALFAATLAAVSSAPSLAGVTVVGGDDVVRRLSTRVGAEWRHEPAKGLNPGLAAVLAEQPQTWRYALYLPADLPLITQLDVEALVAEAGPGRVVIAPDRWQRGTNALLLPAGRAFVPSLGEDSFRRHITEAKRVALDVFIVERPGLSLDVDTAGDLDYLLMQRPDWWETATALVDGVLSSRV